jgi:hypothetical protein
MLGANNSPFFAFLRFCKPTQKLLVGSGWAEFVAIPGAMGRMSDMQWVPATAPGFVLNCKHRAVESPVL